MSGTMEWLLAEDNPSVRYFALAHLLDRAKDDAQVLGARHNIMASAPVQAILAAQAPEGYWAKPGNGYTPKYRSTAWQILFLAELGADGSDPRVRRGCQYLFQYAQATHGGFSALAGAKPSGAIHCLNGNLIWALVALGFGNDERLGRAVDWLSGAVTGDGFPGYGRLVPGPGFRCGANDGLPCAWGAVKSLRALAALPLSLRTQRAKRATAMAADLLLSRDLAVADYPHPRAGRVSSDWYKLGFPLAYTSDILEALFALGEAGRGRDPRLANAIELVLSKQDSEGRWAMQHSLNGKMWADIEAKGKPSKWVTLRALRALKAAGISLLETD